MKEGELGFKKKIHEIKVEECKESDVINNLKQ